jgi:hypothetical protein
MKVGNTDLPQHDLVAFQVLCRGLKLPFMYFQHSVIYSTFQAFKKNHLDIVKWSYYAMCQVQPIVCAQWGACEEFRRAKISEQAAHNGHNGLEWPSTHLCTIQKIPFWNFMDGMNLSPRGQFIWSEVFVFFFLAFFFLSDFFFFFGGAHCFSSWAHFGLIFFPATLTTIFFWGNSYLPLQPTYHLSSYQPIYLPHYARPSFVLVLSSITNTWDLGGLGFRVVELQESEEKQGEAWSAQVGGAQNKCEKNRTTR